MEKIHMTQRLLLRRVAVATGAGLLAVVAGLGMAPAGAADDVIDEAEVDVEVQIKGDGVSAGGSAEVDKVAQVRGFRIEIDG